MKCKNCGKIFNESKQHEIYGYNKNDMCQDCITNKHYSPFNDSIEYHQSIAGHKG